MAEGVKRILGDQGLRGQWSASGRAKAEAEFDVRLQAKRYMEIYKELTGGK